jgi:hypothetical protein
VHILYCIHVRMSCLEYLHESSISMYCVSHYATCHLYHVLCSRETITILETFAPFNHAQATVSHSRSMYLRSDLCCYMMAVVCHSRRFFTRLGFLETAFLANILALAAKP